MLTSAVDPVSGAVAFSEVSDPCTDARCDSSERERSISQSGPLGRDDLRGAGRDGGRRRVLGRRIPVRSDRGDTAVRVVRARRPLARRRGRPDRPDTPGSRRDRFRSDSRPSGRSGLAIRRGEVLAGRLAAVRQRIRTDRRLDTASGEELDRIAGNGILAVSPDGRRIAVRDGSLAVRIVDSSGVAAPITVSLSSFPSVADFSPDGSQLAIAAGTGVVVASTETGEIAETLRDHDGAVTAVEFRPTGELVTAGEDGAIITWDLGDWSAALSQRPVARDQVHPSSSMSAPSRSNSPTGVAQVVVAEPAVWEERACQIAGRVLTEQEWAELLGARPYAPACRE